MSGEKRDLPDATAAGEVDDGDSKSAAISEQSVDPASKKQKTDQDVGKKEDDEKEGGSKGEDKKDEDKKAATTTSKQVEVKREKLSANALVIFGLHPIVKKDEMEKILGEFGKVERLEIRRAFASVYCFCDYQTNEEAKKAIETLNGKEVHGKRLIVKLVNDKNDRSKPFAG